MKIMRYKYEITEFIENDFTIQHFDYIINATNTFNIIKRNTFAFGRKINYEKRMKITDSKQYDFN